MAVIRDFRKLALALPEAVEMPHFEKASFRIKKKIFATLDEPAMKAVLKLSLTDQDVFSAMSKNTIYPVPNKWGQQGWTVVELDKVHPEMLADALSCAYTLVAGKK